ncbi:hypothetical protein NC653_008960 [Populus alba x Populus x berolinensis]|uniref:Uncharacterized protein n=1 Tax=Populus alba x Populus x berolinensis TaxID=444605 RepID=A0AAD6R843_9ROSI|nr:hypothetical protein NC653_008960 [Populus alba x Populus x berolinensis]
MVVNINWADLVHRLTSSPSDFRIELRIAKTEKAKKLDVLHNKPEEIADFLTGQVKSLHVRRKPDHFVKCLLQLCMYSSCLPSLPMMSKFVAFDFFTT